MTVSKTINNTTQQDKQNENQPVAKKSYLTLWIMIFLFALPNVAAFYYYLNRDNIDFGKTTNYGTIISPARPVQDLQLKNIDNSSFKLSSMRGKWILLSIGSTSCQKNCQQNLYKIRQIKKAVGEDHKRINKVFFLTDQSSIESFKSLLNEYPDMEVIIPSTDHYQEFLSGFSVSDEKVEDGIYIIDPLGTYMMAYPKDADANKILKDVRRLLKVSKIG
jgi:cytochrome oxidase Cu insertion factor (SCO1/SenC/PrrC family)